MFWSIESDVLVSSEIMMSEYMTNCIGPLLSTKALMPLLEKAAEDNKDMPVGCSRSAIINISTKVASIADNGMGGLYPYRASKVAQNMVSKNLSIEFGPKGILVAILHPGWVQTDMGTSRAITKTEDSVAGMMKCLEIMTEKDQATFRDFNNKMIPW